MSLIPGYFCGFNIPDSSSREARLIQRKGIAFIDKKKSGSEISELELKLLPHVLSIIEKNCDFATFHKIMMTWNFPYLFLNQHPDRIIHELREKIMSIERENASLKRFLEVKEQDLTNLKRQKM